MAAPILVGLGVTELSVAPAAVPGIKAAVRHVRSDDCRELATRACAAASAHEVRSIVAGAIE
jgi:phosphoenolpyruvate-protein kinase (PTS system EI component)